MTQCFLTHVIDLSIPTLSFLSEISLDVERVLDRLPTTEIILDVRHLPVPYLLHFFNFFLLFLSLPLLIVTPMTFLIRWSRPLQSLKKRHISFQSIFDLGIKIFDQKKFMKLLESQNYVTRYLINSSSSLLGSPPNGKELNFVEYLTVNPSHLIKCLEINPFLFRSRLVFFEHFLEDGIDIPSPLPAEFLSQKQTVSIEIKLFLKEKGNNMLTMFLDIQKPSIASNPNLDMTEPRLRQIFQGDICSHGNLLKTFLNTTMHTQSIYPRDLSKDCITCQHYYTVAQILCIQKKLESQYATTRLCLK